MKKWLFLFILTASSAAVPLLLHSNSLLTFILMLLAAVLMLFILGSRITLFVFIATLLCGTTAELTAVHLGIMTFSQNDFFGAPLWLSLTWGNTALGVIALKEFLEKTTL